MRTCLQELKWCQLELKRSITTSIEANRPGVQNAGHLDDPSYAWDLAGDTFFGDEDNPAKQVHNCIKVVNDLAKKVKEGR